VIFNFSRNLFTSEKRLNFEVRSKTDQKGAKMTEETKGKLKFYFFRAIKKCEIW
jgi:hypothetical protein